MVKALKSAWCARSCSLSYRVRANCEEQAVAKPHRSICEDGNSDWKLIQGGSLERAMPLIPHTLILTCCVLVADLALIQDAAHASGAPACMRIIVR